MVEVFFALKVIYEKWICETVVAFAAETEALCDHRMATKNAAAALSTARQSYWIISWILYWLTYKQIYSLG